MKRSYKTILSQVGDLDDIFEIFKLSTDRLIEQGIEQWDYSYPTQIDIKKDIESQESYINLYGNKIVGTICLNEKQDPQYENIDWKLNGKILVIHRLAVHPNHYGHGIGRQLSEFAIQFAKDFNYDAIRLDAYSKNPYSNKLYESLGFTKAEGFCYFHSSKIPFNCWEFKVS